MMQTLFLSNWQHEKNGERLSNPARMKGYQGGDEVKVKKGEMEATRDKGRGGGRGGRGGTANRGVPSYKRRRIRGGGTVPVGRREDKQEL